MDKKIKKYLISKHSFKNFCLIYQSYVCFIFLIVINGIRKILQHFFTITVMEIMSDFINNSKTLSHVMYRIHRNGTAYSLL